MASLSKPNYTQIPNEILDRLMATLSGAQLKVILWIARKTVGWHTESSKITVTEIAAATGLSKTGVVEAVQYLETAELIIQKRNYIGGDEIRRAASEYSLNIEPDDATPDNCPTVNSVDRCKNATVNSVDHSTVNSVDHYIRNKEKEVKKEELLSTPAPSDLPPSNPEVAASPGELSATEQAADIDTVSDAEQFLRWSTQSRKGRTVWKSNKGTARDLERFRALEESRGLVVARRLFIAYLDSNAPAVTQAKWPIKMFLANPDYNDKKLTGGVKAQAQPVQQDLPGVPPANLEPRWDKFEAFAVWDQHIPERAVVWSKRNTAVPAALFDPELTPAKWLEVVLRCRSIIDGDAIESSCLTAPYVLGETHGVLVWNKIIGGVYDFMGRPRGNRNNHRSVADELIASLNGAR